MDVPISPRIAAIQRAVGEGRDEDLDAFWHDIAQHGVPLIEPGPDADHALVTFLWRAAGTAASVVVVGGLAHADVDQDRLVHLPETDLWYRTYLAPAGVRTVYRLSVDGPLGPTVEEAMRRFFMARPDPLNPRTYVVPPDTERPDATGGVASVLEAPGAAPRPWVAPRSDVPTGCVDLHRLRSAILDNERRVWVYTPPEYTPTGAPYPVVLLFDGSEYSGRLVPTPTILDNLIAAGRIPPLVAILPDSLGGETRSRELRPSSPFDAFVIDELLPWARRLYHVSTEPALSVVAGSSAGGLAAASIALRHPDVFGNVLSQSGFVVWKPEDDPRDHWLARHIEDHPAVPVCWYLDVGSSKTRRVPMAARRWSRRTAACATSCGPQAVMSGTRSSAAATITSVGKVPSPTVSWRCSARVRPPARARTERGPLISSLWEGMVNVPFISTRYC